MTQKIAHRITVDLDAEQLRMLQAIGAKQPAIRSVASYQRPANDGSSKEIAPYIGVSAQAPVAGVPVSATIRRLITEAYAAMTAEEGRHADSATTFLRDAEELKQRAVDMVAFV